MVNPSMYISCNKLQRKATLNFIDEIVNNNIMNIHGKCMDIGCGPGDITNDILLPLLPQNAVMLGTDISKSMIEYATKKYSAKKQLKFDVLDIQTKNLPTKYISVFNVIFSSFALHWCNDIRQAFGNIYRMLQPNGIMLVNFVAFCKVFEIFRNMAKDSRFASYIPNVINYIPPYQDSVNSVKEIKELLYEVGFTIIHCSIQDLDTLDNENMDHFATSVLSVSEFFDEMPCDLKEEFKTDFIHQLKETVYHQSNNQKIKQLIRRNAFIIYAQKYVV